MRFLAWLLIHTMYRVRKEGLDHVPDEGGCIVVCNHVSYVDAIVIAACVRRPIRFIMDHRIFRVPLLNWLFRTMQAIPVASAREDAALKEAAFDTAAKALRAGEVVGIFPEGALTSDGEMHAFRPGIERMVAETPVPVVPMALSGLWGSFFSRSVEGKAMRRLRGVFSRIALAVAPPVPPREATPDALHARVLALRGDVALTACAATAHGIREGRAMILLGIFVGFLLGALTLGWTGGLAGAFVGFIAMLAWRSRAQAKAAAQARAAGVSPAPIVAAVRRRPARGCPPRMRRRRTSCVAWRRSSSGSRPSKRATGLAPAATPRDRRGSADRAGDPVRRRRARAARPREAAAAAPAASRARGRRSPDRPPAADALPEGFARASDGTLAPVAAAGIAAASPSSPVPERLPPRAVSAGAPNPLWAWFTGGNALTRIGVIALFFGVAFLLKYLAEIVTVPIELKLVGVALAGGRARRARRAARARAAGLRPVAAKARAPASCT